MCLAPNVQRGCVGNFGVALGGCDVGVSEQFLNRAEIGFGPEKVGCEGMAQGMRGGGLWEPVFAPVVTHSSLDDAGIERAATYANEQRGGGIRLRMVAEPRGDGLANDGQHGDGSLFLSFAGNAQHRIVARQWCVSDTERESLGDAEATAVKEGEQGGVACFDGLGTGIVANDGGEFASIRFGEGTGIGTDYLRGCERSDAGVFACVAAGEIAEESPERRDATCAGRGAEAGLVACCEPGAEIGGA